MALVVPSRGGRAVTRAKKLMSDLIRGQGRVPLRPIPRRVIVFPVEGHVVRTGVVATTRMRVCVGAARIVLDSRGDGMVGGLMELDIVD